MPSLIDSVIKVRSGGGRGNDSGKGGRWDDLTGKGEEW